MRTTVTIDEDLAVFLEDKARRTGQTICEVANAAIRDGMHRGWDDSPCVPPVHDLGSRPDVDLTKALQLIGRMEDEAIIRRLAEHS